MIEEKEIDRERERKREREREITVRRTKNCPNTEMYQCVYVCFCMTVYPRDQGDGYKRKR